VAQDNQGTRLKARPIGWHYLWAAVAAGAYFSASRIAGSSKLLCGVDGGTRSSLYISLATTTGALLGFAITGITILLTLGSGRRVDWLFASDDFAYVRTIFLGAIRSLALATILFSVLIVIDAQTHGHTWAEAIAVGFVVLVILRGYRVVKLLGDLLDIAIKDRKDAGSANPSFTQPVDDPE
jgi:hypothetical protein